MDYEWVRKTIIDKTRFKKFKKHQKSMLKGPIKNQSQIAACERKTTSEKANFCSNTVFSLYFKNRAKMKMCEQIFKIRQRPKTIKTSLNCKNIAAQVLTHYQELSFAEKNATKPKRTINGLAKIFWQNCKIRLQHKDKNPQFLVN